MILAAHLLLPELHLACPHPIIGLLKLFDTHQPVTGYILRFDIWDLDLEH